MKTKIGWLFHVALLLGAGGAPEEQKKEIAKLAGAWTVSELTYNGEDHSKLKFNFVFKGDEVTIEGNDRVQKEYARIKIKVDAAAKPKIMDFTITAGIQKDAAIEGIYELKGDELRICAKVFGKDRPTEFASPDGASVVLIVLKRAAP